MTNDISTIKARGGTIAKMAAGLFADHCAFIKSIDKADESDFDGKNEFKSGDTIYINKPAQFIHGTSADITSNISDFVEDKVALTINNRFNVAIALTSAEIATDLGLKSWAKRVLEPQMITLSSAVEKEALRLAYLATSNLVGTPNSTVFDTDTILSAGEKIDVGGCADYDNRFVLLNPAANRSAVNARKGLFNASPELSKQYKKGAMGEADGFSFLRNNLLPTHTNGNDIVFEVRTTVSTQGATSLVVEGLTTTTGTVKAGTVFVIADRYAVHPVTKATLPHLKQFVVLADVTADGSGYATLTVDPIYTTGGRQNISSFPTDGDAITPVGAYSTGYAQNLAYHKSAFRFASVPLVQPDGVDMVGQATKDGITVRIVRDYDPRTDVMINRVDVFWGFAAVRPEWACRIIG